MVRDRALGIALAGGLSSCGKSIVPWKKEKLRPESYWNVEGVWIRVGENPATYQPVGYTGPMTEEAGEWVVDKRDGKRFFVPNVAVNDMSPGVLRHDALKNSGQGL